MIFCIGMLLAVLGAIMLFVFKRIWPVQIEQQWTWRDLYCTVPLIVGALMMVYSLTVFVVLIAWTYLP